MANITATSHVIILWLSVLGVVCLTLGQKPWEAVRKDKKWWMKRHQQNVNTTRTLGKDINVVFIGSSSIEYWGTTGKEIWDEKYAPMGAVNYGIRGDRTEYLLWRIENGELDFSPDHAPKLVVLYIGCNKPMDTRPPDDECARGINTVIDRIHEKLPNASILYVALFPRGDREPVRDQLLRTRNITDILKPLIDSDTTRKAHFIDLFWSYAPSSLDGIYEEFYREDKLHQNLKGYKQWASLMNDKFNSLV